MNILTGPKVEITFKNRVHKLVCILLLLAFSFSEAGPAFQELVDQEHSHPSACDSFHSEDIASKNTDSEESGNHADCACGCETRRGSCCTSIFLMSSTKSVYLSLLNLNLPQFSSSKRPPLAPTLEGPFQPPEA